MNLTEIPDGSTLFVDANIFIYAVEKRSLQCRRLLDRANEDRVTMVSSTLVLAEVCHRRMLNEARELELISGGNPARLLGRKPQAFAKLGVYADNIRQLLDRPVGFVPVLAEDFFEALDLQKRHGLLTNDSLNLALARRLGIPALATADSNFDSAQGILVYKPDDIAA